MVEQRIGRHTRAGHWARLLAFVWGWTWITAFAAFVTIFLCGSVADAWPCFVVPSHECFLYHIEPFDPANPYGGYVTSMANTLVAAYPFGYVIAAGVAVALAYMGIRGIPHFWPFPDAGADGHSPAGAGAPLQNVETAK